MGRLPPFPIPDPDADKARRRSDGEQYGESYQSCAVSKNEFASDGVEQRGSRKAVRVENLLEEWKKDRRTAEVCPLLQLLFLTSFQILHHFFFLSFLPCYPNHPFYILLHVKFIHYIASSQHFDPLLHPASPIRLEIDPFDCLPVIPSFYVLFYLSPQLLIFFSAIKTSKVHSLEEKGG